MWDLFKEYHYLNRDINKACHFYVAWWNRLPVGCVAACGFPGAVVCSHPYPPPLPSFLLLLSPDLSRVGSLGPRVAAQAPRAKSLWLPRRRLSSLGCVAACAFSTFRALGVRALAPPPLLPTHTSSLPLTHAA